MFEQTDLNGKTGEKPVSGANNFIDPAGARDIPGDGIDNKKRKLLVIGTIFVLIVIAFATWFLVRSFRIATHDPSDDVTATTTEPTYLGGLQPEGDDGDLDEDGVAGEGNEVEYMSFADFYQQPAERVNADSYATYDLPLNVKVDVANYYELSRKLNLEGGLTALNNQGFVVIDNPFAKEAPDFYALTSLLDQKQIPLYVSADFISYYYQNALKAAFKDVEEGVFFDSLWQISKALYDSSRARYEAHFSEVGTRNDRILEGERLQTAFFAVALELLKPQVDQVDTENKFNAGKFSVQEKQRLDFTVPSYLRDDVIKELELIRSSREKKKSPVLLYDRDYKDFLVPAEYKDNARLNNFYLAAAWLNSVFPLNYRDETCADCLLDRDDWRINFTAASLIAQDFAKNQELKNEWARVYKTMSFFKGLRDTWDYVGYRDSAKNLFGEDYDIALVFAEDAPEGEENMQKLRRELLARTVVPMQGGLSLQTMEGYKRAGFQFLADFYWPNEFIFGRVSYPTVGVYQGGDRPAGGNVTACMFDRRNQRCQGSGQDILKMIYPDWTSTAYLENSNYANYNTAMSALRPQANEAMKGQLNNYWSSLFIWQNHLNAASENLPPYLRTTAWTERKAISALGAWTDMQLPADKLTLRKQDYTTGLAILSDAPDFALVEPSVVFYDRLLAHNRMILEMFQALGLGERSTLATNRLRDSYRQLENLRTIAEKQSKGEKLVAEDTQVIREFARMQTVEKAGSKILSWSNGFLGATLKERLHLPSLMVIAHKAGEEIVFAVGPVFNYQESK
ncbi:MAG: DUF3160 domain-containing protein [bacterium]|nr:DUF3160 domain-containing protein [bacterium]